MENIIICHHCKHKMTKEQKLCHYTVVGIKFLMHFCCAVDVKERAKKTLHAIANNADWFFTGELYPFEKTVLDSKIHENYYVKSCYPIK